MLVAIIDIGTSSIEGGAVAGGEFHRVFDTLINGIKVGIRLFHGAEVVATVPVVHIESKGRAVDDDFPFGPVEGLSVDDGRVHNLNSYGFNLNSKSKVSDKIIIKQGFSHNYYKNLTIY